MPDDDESHAVVEATDILYSGPPDQFMQQRSNLSKAARAHGDTAAAKAITALRRPTAAAAVVNRFVRCEPDSVDRLLDIGTRLRAAHEALDAGQLRELSTERRTLVAELSRDALSRFGDSPSAALRDDVSNTLDAAVADPEIAGRLGVLLRPEHWSGFGVATGSGPELTLVRGGKNDRKPGNARPTGSAKNDRSTKATAPTESSEPAKTAKTAKEKPSSEAAAARRRSARVLAKARDTFDDAEAALSAALQDEQAGADHVRTLGDQLADLSRDLDEAKRQLDASRRALKSARTKRREARSALDRAERNAATD